MSARGTELDLLRNSLPDNTTHTCRFEINSATSDRVYVVSKAKRNGEWQCSCKGWIRWRHCKHLDTLRPFLQEAEKAKPSLKEGA